MNAKTLTIAAGAVAAVAVAAVIVIAALNADPGEEPRPSGAAPTSSIITGEEGAVVPVDRVGQAAGEGFEPLTIPAGVTAGIGADIPDEQLTAADTELSAGDLIVANLYQPDANADPYVLLSVDEFTDPLTGEARAAAFAAAALTDDDTRLVQKVTVRVRHIAGSGDVSAWNLIRSVVPMNLSMEAMTVIDVPGCAPSKAPLNGHDGSTNDTVQACFYVFGSVATPASPIGSMVLGARYLTGTDSLYVQSDKGFDLGLEDAHQRDHDEQGWEIDPKTGLPVIDPATGKPVPADH